MDLTPPAPLAIARDLPVYSIEMDRAMSYIPGPDFPRRVREPEPVSTNGKTPESVSRAELEAKRAAVLAAAGVIE